MLLRRIHLYVGLFLLPWVFLYGITGAMYNHTGLFPHASMQDVDADSLSQTLSDFPTQQQLAKQVVEALQAAAPDSDIQLDSTHAPEFANEVILEVKQAGVRRAVHIDPVKKSAWVATFPENDEVFVPLLSGVSNVQLEPNPYEIARQAVPKVLENAGIQSAGTPKPLGWSKLNFLATVDGEPARVTYVLRDGHVDVTRHEGHDGMSVRQFFLRMHTTHGQPPHWNGRMFWSVVVDIMAIAMVTWGITGLVMWWQIKRTRRIGAFVIALSIATAAILYWNLMDFYATTKL